MTTPGTRARNLAVTIAAIVAIGFGALTLASGGTILFGGKAAREAAGNVVDFVLWFNFISGFAYVGIGAGLLLRRAWSARAAVILAFTIAAVGIAFAAHALAGGLYEARTVAAMSLRTIVWIAIAAIACRALPCFALRKAA